MTGTQPQCDYMVKMGWVIGHKTMLHQCDVSLTSQHPGPWKTLVRFQEEGRLVHWVAEYWGNSYLMAFSFSCEGRAGKDWRKEMPKLIVKTLEESLQGRPGIMNMIRNTEILTHQSTLLVHPPPRLLQPAPIPLVIIIISAEWQFCWINEMKSKRPEWFKC